MRRLVTSRTMFVFSLVWLFGTESIAAGAATAGEPGTITHLSLWDAVELALARYPSLAISRAGRDQAEAMLDEVSSARLPALRLDAAATRFQEPMPTHPIHGFTPDAIPPFDRSLIQAGLTATYRLFDGGARGAGIEGARSEAEAAAERLGVSEQALVNQLVRTYLRVLSSAEILSAHDRRLEALQSERERVSRFFEAGRAAEVEILRIEAAVASARADQVELGTKLELAERDLARLVGGPRDEVRAEKLLPVSLTRAEMAVVPLEREFPEVLESNPSRQAASRELAAAAAGQDAARSARWPVIDLFGNWIDRGGGAGDFKAEWSTGLQLSYPLFTGGERRSAIDRADARHRGASEHLRLVELEVLHDLDRAASALAEAQAQVASLETAVRRFAEVVRIERLALEAGSGTQTDYLAAEADLLSARARLVEARNREILAHVELARASGELSREWLARSLEVRQ